MLSIPTRAKPVMGGVVALLLAGCLNLAGAADGRPNGPASPPSAPAAAAQDSAQAVPGAATPVATRQSEPQLVDRIVAIVDEEMILQSDLEREIELYRLELQQAGQDSIPETAAIRPEVLDRLVESKLIIAAAKQADITIDEEAVQQGVQQKIEQLVEYFGSQDNLERELLRSGMTLQDYRDRLAVQISEQQYLRAVVSRFIRPNVEVLENEIEDYYREHEAEMPATPDSLTLANILIPVQPSAETRRAVQQQVALALEALRSGQAFADVARKHSRGPNAARGGAIGVVGRGDLFDANLEEAVFALAEGEVSDPVVSARGVHILRLDAIRDSGRAISQIFFPMEVTERDVEEARLKAEEAYRRLEAGEPFSLVAAEVSSDPVSASKGGLLGTFRLEDLNPQFQEILRERQSGELTEPLLTPAGFYVFLVKNRAMGRQLTFDELKEGIRRNLESQKLEQELAKYVESLRDRFFIDLKG
jgi:peptidyl-prolyl cis-trans isomerase SurA